MKALEIYLLRGGEILSNIDVKQYEFKELSRKDNIKSAIESMLFVSGEPLSLRDLSNNLEIKENDKIEVRYSENNELVFLGLKPKTIKKRKKIPTRFIRFN